MQVIQRQQSHLFLGMRPDLAFLRLRYVEMGLMRIAMGATHFVMDQTRIGMGSQMLKTVMIKIEQFILVLLTRVRRNAGEARSFVSKEDNSLLAHVIRYAKQREPGNAIISHIKLVPILIREALLRPGRTLLT